MNCKDIKSHIDDYLDRQLTEKQQWAFVRHVEGCNHCAAMLGEALTLQEGLKQLPVEQPASDFEERMFARVRRHYSQPRKEHQRFNFATGFATAAVFSLMIWFVSSVYLSDAVIQQPQIISVAMNETQTVRLLFDSPKDIQQVSLSLDLPQNMELQGYPGRSGLVWQTSLQKGQNILALPVLAIQPGQGELMAQLSYGDKVKTFSVVLRTTDNSVQRYQLKQVKQIS